MSSIQQLLDNLINSFDHLNLIPICLSSLLLIFIQYKWHLKNPSRNKNLPPSPPKLPILGHLLKLGTHPPHSLRSLSQKYGDLMMIYLGKNPALVISSSKMAKEIMKTNDAVVSNRIQSTITNKLLYNCRNVATSPYGEYWRQMKTIYVLQLLCNKRVLSFKGIREEETLLLMEKVLKELEELPGVFDVGDFIPWLGNYVKGLSKEALISVWNAETDKSYSVLEWTMAKLLKHPNVMKEVQREIRGFDKDKDHITENDLEEMKTRVMINAWAITIHRDPEIWEEPKEFRPERFMNSSIDFKGHGFELVPFGGGRRICPGISFASIIIELVLANLMYKFNWTLSDGVQCDTLDMSETVGLTILAASGYCFKCGSICRDGIE
ncbi:cytochrome P450 736A117-like [Amaranthus tricolor]|uniref:cytochrome P450 736A117-like n=1 Tax=Amaranthus tricolor TaxID=29722 RepID=UPI00258D50B3|nr:cytochrome P450 736A117-like [Amaranthus tricolor]